jgi:DNA-binding transcriptional regulator PaaX
MGGKIEARGKKRARRRNIKRAILSVVQLSAVVGVAVAMPNLPSALHKFGLLPTRNDAGVVARARNRYLKAGLIAKDKNGRLQLTAKGKSELEKMEANTLDGRRPARWDGRWRVLIFDIPEARKSMRVRVRRNLQSSGFLRLQDSVWIYPFDCEDFITLLKVDLRVGKDLLYMIVDELENDAWVRREFGL